MSCTGARDGDVLVSASGGVPGSVYTYAWSTGAAGPRISFLTKGNYTVTVTDANNCVSTATFAVQEPSPITVTVETAPRPRGLRTITTQPSNSHGGTRPIATSQTCPIPSCRIRFI
ncbi:MAG: SprB repeat-containing protein [Haliscomenobacter sp.]|nr:SprB repeat-containing protein [Haliscomenobacter sp.]